MKKIISFLIVVLMLCVLFAGCGGQANTNVLPAGDKEASGDPATTKEAALAEQTPDAPKNSAGGSVAESYTAYLDAKNVVLEKLVDGISNNPDTGMVALSFFGVSMADLVMLPASMFGQDQQAAEIGLGFMGAQGVTYSENGNSYTIAYSEEDGKAYVFSGTYDPAADALICTATTDGAENIYSEYRKTAFGYVGQYYFLNDDGTTSIYKIAVDGEDGTIGISSIPGKPAALTGSESADFPKVCEEWYSVTGTTITGQTLDGTDLNFEYTPTESASN